MVRKGSHRMVYHHLPGLERRTLLKGPFVRRSHDKATPWKIAKKLCVFLDVCCPVLSGQEIIYKVPS